MPYALSNGAIEMWRFWLDMLNWEFIAEPINSHCMGLTMTLWRMLTSLIHLRLWILGHERMKWTRLLMQEITGRLWLDSSAVYTAFVWILRVQWRMKSPASFSPSGCKVQDICGQGQTARLRYCWFAEGVCVGHQLDESASISAFYRVGQSRMRSGPVPARSDYGRLTE